MELLEHDNNNKIVQNESGEHFEFKYNFVNTPWDDRSWKSKAGIVSLLLAIFGATMACVVHNLYTHFSNPFNKQSRQPESKCNLVKVDDYKYAARIHSVETQELICVGAVLSSLSVLASGICVMSGPIRLRVGSPTDPRCRKGFPVDVIVPVNHDGVISKHMVLLSSYESMADCVHTVISLGRRIDWRSQAYIIGRPLRGGRSLSRQPAHLVDVKTVNPGFTIKDLNLKMTICVMDVGTCPVRAGDLLVKNGYLIGIASTSTHITDQSKLACFADLRIVRGVFLKLDPRISFV